MLAFLILAAVQTSSSVAREAFDRLAAKVPLELVRPAAASDLAGHYTGQTSELEARVGPFLGGEDLYLFPDGSYVYCEWTDVMPRTVFDKGKWSAIGNLLELVSDADIRWDPEIDRQQIMVRRKARTDEIILIATPRDVEYFEEKAADDPELMLMIVGMVRTEILANKTAAAVKARLMKEAWNPKFFRKQLPPGTRRTSGRLDGRSDRVLGQVVREEFK